MHDDVVNDINKIKSMSIDSLLQADWSAVIKGKSYKISSKGLQDLFENIKRFI